MLFRSTLTSSAASSYLWSNSANTQSIDVTTAGTYAVTVQGLCQAFTSAPITINVLAAPTAPVSNTVNIPVPGTAGLTATGTNITWYDAAIGGTQVGTGNNWTTPFLNADTHFWCSDATIFGGDSLHGGPVDRINTTTPGQYFTNNNFYLLFDAAQDFTIMSVKVYANTAGNRTIAVVDYTLGTTIASGTFNIPNGESRVQLNFAVPAGGPYGLRLVTGTNLWRDGNGSNPAFPYSLGANGAITGTSVTGGNALEYYYFFYDWDVQAASTSCASARTDVLVTVGPLGIGENSNAAMDVFPVPATDQLNIRFGTIAGAVDVELVDVTGRTVLDRHAQATGTMLLDVSSLAAGQYQLRVRHQGGTELRRVDVR